jgi:hypothetical protein
LLCAANFIQGEPWDSLAIGLRASERLQQRLRQIGRWKLLTSTKTCASMNSPNIFRWRGVGPLPLLILRSKGECYFDPRENIFELTIMVIV